MRLHKNAFSALEHPASWAGIAGVLSTMGAELDKPYSLVCYGMSAVFSIVAIIMRAPPEDHQH